MRPVYNVRSQVNPSLLVPLFRNIKSDHKVLNVTYQPPNKQPVRVRISPYNTFAGSQEERMLMKVIELFITTSPKEQLSRDHGYNNTIHVQPARYEAHPFKRTMIHIDDQCCGVFCVSRENIRGGICSFGNESNRWELNPADLIVRTKGMVLQPIEQGDEGELGSIQSLSHLDLIWFSSVEPN